MVDLQLVGILVTATSVTVAAVYYMINLRETSRNRKATFANNILQDFQSAEGIRRWLDLASMKWDSFDDFVKKYDSAANPDHAAKRIAFWNNCEAIGYQYSSGVIDLDTIFNVTGGIVLTSWVKFKPIMEEYRRWEFGRGGYSNWEHLAEELEKMYERKGEDYRPKTAAMIEAETRGVSQ